MLSLLPQWSVLSLPTVAGFIIYNCVCMRSCARVFVCVGWIVCVFVCVGGWLGGHSYWWVSECVCMCVKPTH